MYCSGNAAVVEIVLVVDGVLYDAGRVLLNDLRQTIAIVPNIFRPGTGSDDRLLGAVAFVVVLVVVGAIGKCLVVCTDGVPCECSVAVGIVAVRFIGLVVVVGSR